MITIDDITFSYGNNTVLKNISMKLEEGKVYGLLGENGQDDSSHSAVRTQESRQRTD